MGNAVQLVVTDLDGTLLDHDSYSWEAARGALSLLEQMRIPVVFATSKTRAEVLALREEMGNTDPFIVENGAAVLIPRRYFERMPDSCRETDGYWLREFAPPRSHWAPVLQGLRDRFGDSFVDFAGAGVAGIAAMTGLDEERAALANQREYSEAVQWRGETADLEAFLAALEGAGARVLRGGRFYSVAGDCDKGRAWRWLREQYALAAGGAAVYDLGLGDGANDVPLLEITHRALRIPAHSRPLPALERTEGLLEVDGEGPVAWSRGVQAWLRERYSSAVSEP